LELSQNVEEERKSQTEAVGRSRGRAESEEMKAKFFIM
jgi:hypothetical protein